MVALSLGVLAVAGCAFSWFVGKADFDDVTQDEIDAMDDHR